MRLPVTARTVVRVLAIRGEDELLLVRRAAEESLASHWELPGGRLGDTETVSEALTRELREETGLAPAGPPALVACAERVTPSGRHITEYAFAVPADGELRLS